MTFTLGQQNMTEGPVTRDLRDCEIVCVQEVDTDLLDAGMPRRHDAFATRKVPGLAITWDTTELRVHRVGAVRFHDSGVAEGWPIKTPPRGVIWVVGKIDSVRVVVFTTWLLNSWRPVRPDRFTAKRHRIVIRRELPVLRDRIRHWHEQGLIVLGGADVNTLTPVRLPGMRTVHRHGLDRVVMDRRSPFKVKSTRVGERTGVGRDMQHPSLLVELR